MKGPERPPYIKPQRQVRGMCCDDQLNPPRKAAIRLKVISAKCQFRTHAPQQIRPIRHLVAAAEHRMRYLRIDPDRGSNHAGRPADVWSNADSWVVKPS